MLIVNTCSCRRVRRAVTSALLICSSIAMLAVPIRADAQFTGTVSATGNFENNSNVFASQNGVGNAAPDAPGRSDTDYTYGAQFNGIYKFDRQQIYASASTSEFDYQHDTELDHNEYKLDTGLNWIVGDSLDGNLDVSRIHTMVPTYDLVGIEDGLALLTSQNESAQIGFKVTPDWKVQASISSSRSEEPLVGTPEVALTTTGGTASINYLGIGNLSTGLLFGYSSGEYAGYNGGQDSTYSQSSAQLTASYAHIRTTFGAQLGYSRRESSNGTNSTSGLTGSLSIMQQLTPKTTVSVNVSRAINSFLLNAGSEIDTIAGVSANWQATAKLAVALSYTFTYRDYPGQGNDPVGSDRIDRQQSASLGINYQPQKWLMIRPYANLQRRTSNLVGGNFNQDIFGVAVTVTPPIHMFGLNP